MRLGNRQFSPKLWAIILYVTVLFCMLFLGNWQLERAALKVSLQNAAKKANNAAATELISVTDFDKAASSYQRVSIRGKYDAERQLLWDNRTYKGQAGFEIIVPMKTSSGQWVLINRGWLAPGASRQQLPDVSLPVAVIGSEIVIEGLVSQPSQGFASGLAVSAGDGWPHLLQYFDYDAIGDVLGESILPVVIQAQTLGTDGVTKTVSSARPEWLQANWQPAASGPAKHYSYAFQWFAMAIALTILFLVVNSRPHSSTESQV